MTKEAPKQALITGANGITGSAIARYLCEQTTKDEWSRIIITSRSPLQLSFSDPRMEFIALDFSKKPEEIAESLKEVAQGVTHAYFSSYVHRDDFAELNAANSQLFEHFMQALVQTSPRLENVTLQTGGKHYNVHLGPVDSPAREDEPRRQASIDNFYFPQEDALIALAEKSGFAWVSTERHCLTLKN
jgi:nucleoside-diphosphate-sugar epimerase